MTNGFEFGVGLLNFCLLLVILKFIVIDPLKKVAVEREAKAKESIAKAESVLKDAQASLEKYRQLVDNLEQEKQSIAANAERDARAELEKSAAQAESEAKSTLSRAEGEVGAEQEQALAEIRGQIAVETVAKARGLLEGCLDESARQNMIENFLAQVGAKHA